MQVTAQLSVDDHRDFLDLVAPLYKIRRRIRIVGIFLLVMLFFLVFGILRFVWTLASGFQSGAFVGLLDHPYLFTLITIGLLLIPVAVLWLRSAVPLLGKLFAAGKHGAMDETSLRDGVNIGELQYDFDSEGLWERLALVQSFYAWEAFQSVQETDRNLYLVIDPSCALIVPKRGFDDDTSLQAFKALAASHIGAAL